MIEKLDLLMRFWELRARHASTGEPLDGGEQIELLSLMQLVLGDVHLPKPGNLAAVSDALACDLIGDGVIAHAEIRQVSAGGILVATKMRVLPGARFLVKTADAIAGVEYTLPCKVIWTHGRSPSSLALEVDGVPSRTAFSQIIDLPKTPPTMAMGRTERLVS